MKDKKWLIYKHTLAIDCPHKGWSYIGQTSMTDPNERWKNGAGYRADHGLVFYRAVQKNTWDAFTHEILEEGITSQEFANEREKYWIAYYHTYIGDPECRGYNMTPGGEQWGNTSFHWYTNGEINICLPSCDSCPEGFRPGRLPLTEKQKEKLRGKERSPEHSKKLGDNNRGRIAMTNGTIDKKVKPEEVEYFEQLGYWRGRSIGARQVGYKHSEETLQKMRESSPHRKLTDEEKEHLRQINLGKAHSDETKQKMSAERRGMKCYTNGSITIRAKEQPEGFWPGVAYTVSEETRAKISATLKGKVQSEETRRKRSQALKGKPTGITPPTAIKMKCVETGIIYPSFTAAMNSTGMTYASIKKSLKTGQAVGRRGDRNKVHFILWEN